MVAITDGGEANQQKAEVNKALMAKICTKSTLGVSSLEGSSAEIPKGGGMDKAGLKSVLSENKGKEAAAEEALVAEKTSTSKADQPPQSMQKKVEERDLVSIPLEIKSKLCSPRCVTAVAYCLSHNRRILREMDDIRKINTEMKENELAYQRKLNATIAEMHTLKEFVLRKDFLINDLTEKLEKSRNETNHLQIVVDKWNVSKHAHTDILDCSRKSFVKDGIGYKDKKGIVKSLFLPLSKSEYIPIPKPHPKNDLFEKKCVKSESNSNISKRSADMTQQDQVNDDESCGGQTMGLGHPGANYSTVNWFIWSHDKSKTSLNSDDCNNFFEFG